MRDLKMTDGKETTSGIETMLRGAGLRPTRQRIELARLLFSDGDRHVTAEMLHAEALSNKISVSLATVYNALNQFCECGLLREIAIEGSKTYLDTNTSNHQHFFFESDGTLIDVAVFSRRLTYEEAPCIIVSAVDITERNRAEARDEIARARAMGDAFGHYFEQPIADRMAQ